MEVDNIKKISLHLNDVYENKSIAINNNSNSSPDDSSGNDSGSNSGSSDMIEARKRWLSVSEVSEVLLRKRKGKNTKADITLIIN